MMRIKCLEWCPLSEHSISIGHGWHYIGRVRRKEKRTKDWALENPNIRSRQRRGTQEEEWERKEGGKRAMASWKSRQQRFLRIKWSVESNTAENHSQMKTEIVCSRRWWKCQWILPELFLWNSTVQYGSHKPHIQIGQSRHSRFCQCRNFYWAVMLWSLDCHESWPETLVQFRVEV